MQNFRSWKDSLDLVDLPLCGRKFTWSNQRADPVFARLDRFLPSKDWESHFPNLQQLALPHVVSDHCPILLVTDGLPFPRKTFRFEMAWLQHNSFHLMIKENWLSFQCWGSGIDTLGKKLSLIKRRIKNWSRAQFQPLKDRKAAILRNIALLDELAESRRLAAEEIDAKLAYLAEYHGIAKEEETYWRQRSKAHWLAEGDRNTSFFHRVANGRRRKNHIPSLWIGENLTMDEREKKQAFKSYFSDMFATRQENVLPVDWRDLYGDSVFNLSHLEAEFTEEEVQAAVFQMKATKAPGPDGISMSFYQTFWDVIKADVLKAFNDFHSGEGTLDRLNYALVTLLPKVDGACRTSDFRPISLINCSFKIFTKVLANRLAPLLPHLVDITQSAFQSKKSTLDSCVVANEMIHSLTKKKAEAIMLKIDFKKAFDLIDWRFIESLLVARGFGRRWCGWISQILSTSKLMINVNGSWTEQINCRRGLRQGDPLSPLLFILAVDVLQKMMRKGIENGTLQALNLRGRMRDIHSLQFADDTLLFCKASRDEVVKVKLILYLFEGVSGLSINYAKSSIVYFGKFALRKALICALLDCPETTLPIKYLGLPIHSKALTKNDWLPLLDRIQGKLKGWKRTSLSYGGRLVLVNSVLTAMPLYYLSFYKLPAWVLQRIDKFRRSFLWGKDGKGVSKVNWVTAQLAKEAGGLGILNMKDFNTALLGKWAWKAIKGKGLAGEILRSKYLNSNNPLQRSLSSVGHSSFWRSIHALFPLVTQWLQWQASAGDQICFWLDKWVGFHSLAEELPEAFSLALNVHAKVSDYHSAQGWQPLLRRAHNPRALEETEILKEMLAEVQLQRDSPDEVSWTLTKHGDYSVKSFYSRLSNRGTLWSPARFIWRSCCPLKVKFFGWLLCLNRLPTKANLLARGWQGDEACVLCGMEPEDTDHLFFKCTKVKGVWDRVRVILPLPFCDPFLHSWIQCLTDSGNRSHWVLFLASCWCLWMARNNIIFGDGVFCLENVSHQALGFFAFWIGEDSNHKQQRTLQIGASTQPAGQRGREAQGASIRRVADLP